MPNMEHEFLAHMDTDVINFASLLPSSLFKFEK